MVPYVDAVVAVTVIHVLLLVLHVCMLYQSHGNRGSVGRVFWLLGPGSGGVGWCYVCVSCESGFSV